MSLLRNRKHNIIFEKYIKFAINDCIFIDDINEIYICMYFTKYIHNKYILMSMYINRYDGTIKELLDTKYYMFGVKINSFNISNDFALFNYKKFKLFIKYLYDYFIKENNRLDYIKLEKYKDILINISYPISEQII